MAWMSAKTSLPPASVVGHLPQGCEYRTRAEPLGKDLDRCGDLAFDFSVERNIRSREFQ